VLVYRAELSMVIAMIGLGFMEEHWNVKISFHMHENASEGTSKFIYSVIRAM
jgi:hypothetical protein